MAVLSSSRTCFAPSKPHFVQPCLPGFTHQLSIPDLFFKNYLLGHKSQDVTLRSNLCRKTWNVKINGGKLTNGWKELVAAHGVQLGDVVVFRHEGNSVFYVTVFDSTACEREYPPYVFVKKEDSGMVSTKLGMKKKASSSTLQCSNSVVTVTASTIKKHYMRLPNEFVRKNGLENKIGEIEFMDGDGRIWSAKLNRGNTRETYFIGRGWRPFCIQNRLKKGDSLKIEVIQLGDKPILKISNCS